MTQPTYTTTVEVPCTRCDQDGKVWVRKGWAEYPEPCPLCMGTRKIFKRVKVEVPHDLMPPPDAA